MIGLIDVQKRFFAVLYVIICIQRNGQMKTLILYF